MNEQQQEFVPKSVTDAGSKANELIKGLNKTDADAPAIETDNQNSKPIEGEIKAEDGKEAAPPIAKEPEKKEESAETWKQKYSVLQGKYNAEVPRLNAQIHTQADEIARLKQELETAKATPKPADSGKNIDAAPDDDDLDPDEFAEYGDGFVKLAKETKKNKAMAKEIEDLKKSVGSAEEDRKNKTFETFYQDIAEWDHVNMDPDFLTWLKTDIHPSFGEPRHAKFAESVNRADSGRVIAIFKEYQDSHPRTETPAKTTAQQKPTPKNIQPPRRAESVDLTADGKRTWTPSQMKEHYAEKTKGKWSGREDEWKKLETDLLTAQGQGRLRPD